MTNFEFLVSFSVACGSGLRFALSLIISLKGRCTDIPTVMTDVSDVISATYECQLNMINLGHEWYSRANDYQTMGPLDETGDSTNGDNYTARTPQPLNTATMYFHRTFRIPFITDLILK